MKFYADLHIHSSYSRATSSELTIENLHAWGQRKGITLIGTGDCLHPAWLGECRKKLHDDGNGLFSLKKEYAADARKQVPAPCSGPVSFMLTTEISTIYKKGGRVRKVHNVVCLPSFAAVERLITRLERIGNLKSDGRPILGLDSRDLLETVLEADPAGILIPAHIWTPWFSALGSKSGFDSIEECYADLTPHIHAVETGLSSDPPMNWRLSSLDPFGLVSFSDAHSPSKLGRECTIFNTGLSYDAIFRALADPADPGLAGTVEFFPEEGKYHVDGHRKCGVRFMPEETIAHKGICPKCGKPLTVGVLSRVEELADRKTGAVPPRGRPFKSLIPLSEVIAEALDCGPATQAAQEVYGSLLNAIGGEFTVLLEADAGDIARHAGAIVAEGIKKMRSGRVAIDAGYDGEFGTVKIFTDAERKAIIGQENLFGVQALPAKARPSRAAKPRTQKKTPRGAPEGAAAADRHGGGDPLFSGVNAAQKEAIRYPGRFLLIVAGPGTGKTHTLTRRIACAAPRLAPGASCLALTFTNKAAEEMRERLERFGPAVSSRVRAVTIHAFCLDLLRTHPADAGLPTSFEIAGPDKGDLIARQAWPDLSAAEARARHSERSRLKSLVSGEPLPEFVQVYDAVMLGRGVIDFDTILERCRDLLRSHTDILKAARGAFPFIFVDEYQDINAVQHEIILLLAGESGEVTAIGDPNQSIYAFRGSNVAFFDGFAHDFAGTAVLALTENYRTAPVIIRAFSQVIERAGERKPPPLESRVSSKGRLVVYTGESERAEASFVAGEIERLVGGTSMLSHDAGRVTAGAGGDWSFGDIAVLYRTNAARAWVEEALGRAAIPCTVTGEKPFYARPSSSLLLALLRFAAGETVPAETLCSLLLESVPELSPHETSILCEEMKKRRSGDIAESGLETLLSPEATVPGHIRRAFSSFLETVRLVGGLLASSQIEQALAVCATLSLWKKDCEASAEAAAIRERLMRIARTSLTFRAFLDTVLLQREDDGVWGRSEAITLSTLHASKGLEWPVVFIIGCEDGLIPLSPERGSTDPAEERRLFYVGMSRAKEILYLTNAKRRFSPGGSEPRLPSPFLADIDDELKSSPELLCTKKRQSKPDAEQLSLF